MDCGYSIASGALGVAYTRHFKYMHRFYTLHSGTSLEELEMAMVGVFPLQKAINTITWCSFFWRVGCKTFTSTPVITALFKSGLQEVVKGNPPSEQIIV